MVKNQSGGGLRTAMWGFASGFLMLACLTAPSSARAAFLQAAQSAGSQGNTQSASTTEPMAEQVYKNIQVLKGTPASQLKTIMNLISISVGMKCDQCHVPDAYEKDDKRGKQTARRMIQLVLDVNKGSFQGQTQVSCYSCHRGQAQPVAVPPIGAVAAPAPPQGPRPDAAGAGLPTFDQIMEKYQAAIGTSEAYAKLKSRVMKGFLIDGKGTSYPLEVYQAAPDKMVMIAMLPNGFAARGYNGMIGWESNPSGQTELKGSELTRVKHEADMARFLKLREVALSPRVMGKTNVGDRDAFQVMVRADGMRVQLFFDAQTGLLIRRRDMSSTVVGSFPEQIDYEDYRDVDSVKLPFTIRYTPPDPSAGNTLQFKEITHNVPVDEARFNPPAVKK
jgi:hypothetical protein